MRVTKKSKSKKRFIFLLSDENDRYNRDRQLAEKIGSKSEK